MSTLSPTQVHFIKHRCYNMFMSYIHMNVGLFSQGTLHWQIKYIWEN